MSYPYFECHVTVAPVFNAQLELFKNICIKYNFKVAELLMKKDKDDPEILSQLDSFSSAKSNSFHEMKNRLANLLSELKSNSFTILRYKIEFSAWDSKYEKFLGE